MKKQSTKNRRGNTGRTSSQGRKLASGKLQNKTRGSADMNEDTKNQVKDEKPKKKRIPAGAIVK